MRIAINNLHKAFESRIRLGIMSALLVNDALTFNTLKEYLDVTDGNLASHVKGLEKEKFIGVKKLFIDRKPNTQYHITKLGKKVFEEHIATLEAIIKQRI